jgi:hypothetical protein
MPGSTLSPEENRPVNSLHDEVSRLLAELHVEPVFRAIHAGDSVPILTDYFVQRLPDEWNSAIPPEYVDGRKLIPLFIGCDSYAVYCVDSESREIFEIDPEDPWPPTRRYNDWHEFVAGLCSTISEDKPDQIKHELERLLSGRAD